MSTEQEMSAETGDKRCPLKQEMFTKQEMSTECEMSTEQETSTE